MHIKMSIRKKLILTCDTEALEFPIKVDSFYRNIFGKVFSGDSQCGGIEIMMEICDRFSVKINFFYDVFTEYSRHGANHDVAECILGNGHHMSLHAHIEHLPDLWWHQRGYKKPTWAANYFDDTAATYVYEDAVKLFKKAAGFQPLAFRAGSWRYCRQTLNAVWSAGIKYSFNYYPLSAIRSSFPHGPDAGILNAFQWSNGLIEVPTTCVRGPTVFSNNQKYVGFEAQIFTKGIDYIQYLKILENNHPEIDTIVFVLHSWSFMNRIDGVYATYSEEKANAFTSFIESTVDKYDFVDLNFNLPFSHDPEHMMHVPIEFAGEGGSPLQRL